MDQRIEFAMKAINAESLTELCRQYGISRKTGYKWRERFVERGVSGMNELSRRPKRHRAELGEEVVCQIVQLKNAHPHWGPRKIRELYRRKHGSECPSESSFKRVLERTGLTQKRKRIKNKSDGGRLEAPVQGESPNALWTVDFKGWWRDKAGGKVTPLTVRDAHSRFILEMRAVEDGTTSTIGKCFERLFETHGLPQAIRSDNGTPFACSHGLLGLTRLSAWWLALGIDLVRGRPGCPQDNGAHERLHLDIFRELESGRVGNDQAAFDLWRHEFNTQRPHESLGMDTPAEHYHPSERSYQGTPGLIDYGSMATRQVNASNGMISYGGDSIVISAALGGWNVGLCPRHDGCVEVWFSKLLIGHLDTKTASFTPILPPTRQHRRADTASFWPSPLRSEDPKDANNVIDQKQQKL